MHPFESLVGPLRDDLADLQQLIDDAVAALSDGLTLAQLLEIPDDQLESLHRLACELREGGHADDAMVVAVHLALHQPREERFIAMAVQCLQALGMRQSAIGMQILSLANDASMAKLVKLAHGFLALGDEGQALGAFEAALQSSECREQDADQEDYCARNIRMLRFKLGG
ncbi:MAG: hypothetical protein V4787_04395 [Pseudomonadota bacterium]